MWRAGKRNLCPTAYLHTYLTTSVTRCLDYMFNIWPSQTMKICSKLQKNCLRSFKILKNALKTPKTLFFCQSGEIMPNMVTLLLTYLPTLVSRPILHFWKLKRPSPSFVEISFFQTFKKRTMKRMWNGRKCVYQRRT